MLTLTNIFYLYGICYLIQLVVDVLKKQSPSEIEVPENTSTMTVQELFHRTLYDMGYWLAVANFVWMIIGCWMPEGYLFLIMMLLCSILVFMFYIDKSRVLKYHFFFVKFIFVLVILINHYFGV